MEKRLTRLVSDCESEVEQRRARESRILELEKELAIMRLEQKETTRKLEGQEEEKKNVSVLGEEREEGGKEWERVGREGREKGEGFHTLIFFDFLSSSSLSSSFLFSPIPSFSLLSFLPPSSSFFFCVQLQEKLTELSSLATDQQSSSELKKETEQLRTKLTSESKTVAELTKTNKALKQVHCLRYTHDGLG